mmetsp:Transcript_1332/g.4193  ORF Transcript_1332/g.4193 Transcript_1332/m.4193 type:complete len:204 (+) Transcript_1332:463-1074(+)
MYCTLSMSVWLRRMRPAGRAPLSMSSSHSWPSTPFTVTYTSSPRSCETAECRHARSGAKAAGTSTASTRCALTVHTVPVSPLDGHAGKGLMSRASRHVPVQPRGSRRSVACVSLKMTIVRMSLPLSLSLPAAAAARLGSHRTRQYASLPLQNTQCTPASLAAVMASRCSADQYSSCPTDKKTPWRRMRWPRRAESTPVVYRTS